MNKKSINYEHILNRNKNKFNSRKRPFLEFYFKLKEKKKKKQLKSISTRESSCNLMSILTFFF